MEKNSRLKKYIDLYVEMGTDNTYLHDKLVKIFSDASPEESKEGHEYLNWKLGEERKISCKKCQCEIPKKIADKYRGYCKNCFKEFHDTKKNKKSKVLIIVFLVLLIIMFTYLFVKSAKENNLTNGTTNESYSTKSKYEKIIKKIEDGTATSKEIEELFVDNKNNEEARSIYYYDCAKYYKSSKINEDIKGMSNIEKEKYYIMRISPEYNKVLSNEIIDFGINLFGNKEEWNKQYELGKQINERQQKIYQGDYTKAKEIYNYIKTKYDEYYQKNGKEANDQYSSTLFEEVANKFEITVLEANDIWGNLIMNVENNINTSNSSNSKRNTSSNSSSNKETSYTSSVTEDEKGYAVAVAKAEVKEKLKSPSSAKFPWGFDEYKITKSGKTFTVNSYVEASNSFGTKIKTRYTVKFTMTGKETYKIISVIIDE